MLCSEGSIVNRGSHSVRIVTLRCRSWTCPLCQPNRHFQLVDLAKSGKPSTFITLTVNPRRGVSAFSRARDLAKAWPKVVKAIRKRYGYGHIPYFCVFEATKKGEPHLHILARVKFVDQKWLSTTMRRLIGAPIVHIRKVKGQKQVANYIAKYVGKEPHRFETCKRYWTTRSWRLSTYSPQPIEGTWSDNWIVYQWSADALRCMYEGLGYEFGEVGRVLVGYARAPPLRRFEDATI